MIDDSGLKTLLKKAHPMIRRYISQLQKRIEKLQTKNADLEAEKIENRARIKALQKLTGAPDLGERLRRARQRVAS